MLMDMSVISQYTLKRKKKVQDLLKCFHKNWRGPTQGKFSIWKVEIWAPVAGRNGIFVCYGIDINWYKGTRKVTGPEVQKTIRGLNDIIVPSKTKTNVYHIIRGRCVRLNKNNESNPDRYLATSQYTLKKGKKIKAFLDCFDKFLLREMQDKAGVENVEVLALEPKKPHIINCRYTIFNYDNWKKRSAEMEKSMCALVDQSKTLTEVYSRISCIPEADSELDRSMNYVFEKIEREKRRRK